jgi:hypothetical protein
MPKDLSPCELEPTPLPVWSIYKIAAKRQWLGIVQAPDATAAIEAAAKKFKTDDRNARFDLAALQVTDLPISSAPSRRYPPRGRRSAMSA